jgi:hypothetical protein
VATYGGSARSARPRRLVGLPWRHVRASRTKGRDQGANDRCRHEPAPTTADDRRRGHGDHVDGGRRRRRTSGDPARRGRRAGYRAASVGTGRDVQPDVRPGAQRRRRPVGALGAGEQRRRLVVGRAGADPCSTSASERCAASDAWSPRGCSPTSRATPPDAYLMATVSVTCAPEAGRVVGSSATQNLRRGHRALAAGLVRVRRRARRRAVSCSVRAYGSRPAADVRRSGEPETGGTRGTARGCSSAPGSPRGPRPGRRPAPRRSRPAGRRCGRCRCSPTASAARTGAVVLSDHKVTTCSSVGGSRDGTTGGPRAVRRARLGARARGCGCSCGCARSGAAAPGTVVDRTVRGHARGAPPDAARRGPAAGQPGVRLPPGLRRLDDAAGTSAARRTSCTRRRSGPRSPWGEPGAGGPTTSHGAPRWGSNPDCAVF